MYSEWWNTLPAEFSAHCLRFSSDCRPTSGGDRCVYPITTNGKRYGEDSELFGLAMAKADNSTVVVSAIQQTVLRHYLPHPPLLPVCLSAGWIFLSVYPLAGSFCLSVRWLDLSVCLSAGWIFLSVCPLAGSFCLSVRWLDLSVCLSLHTVCMYALRPSGAVKSQVFVSF